MTVLITAAFSPSERIAMSGALRLAWTELRDAAEASIRAISPGLQAATDIARRTGAEARVSLRPPPSLGGAAILEVEVRGLPRLEVMSAASEIFAALAGEGQPSPSRSTDSWTHFVRCSGGPASVAGLPFLIEVRGHLPDSPASSEQWG